MKANLMRNLCCQVCPFESSMGTMALVFQSDTIDHVLFGYDSEIELLKSIDHEFVIAEPDPQRQSWIELLKRFVDGEDVDLQHLPIRLDGYSEFQQSVIQQCRSIPRGEIRTYGQLAMMAGSPRAARAVGTTMRRNRFPLIVPCHRVVGCTRIGGYSARGGIALKAKLLTMEGVKV